MAYLREVRLCGAHQALLESDPSTMTVTSAAHGLGSTNMGMLAAADAPRFHETPAETLRRHAARD